MIEKIESILVDNEEVEMDLRVHGVVFAPTVVYAIIGLLVALLFHPVVGCVILLMTFYPLYTSTVHYAMTHLVLTNKKVLARSGFLSRDWIQMSFDKIENAYLEEPIVGRYLGYSTVIVSGVGAGAIAVPYVRDGEAFIKRLEEYLDHNRDDDSDPSPVVIGGEDLINSLKEYSDEKK